MSDAGKWKIAFPCDGRSLEFFRRDQVRVCYGTDYSRKSDPVLDGRINAFRQKFLSTPGAYDGSYFRLAGLCWDNGALQLRIGLTTYLEYIAFRSIPDILHGISDSAAAQSTYLPNVIGNVGILLTADDATICIVRSTNVRTYSGYADFPGGHPEPARVGQISPIRAETSIHYEELVRDELFDAVIREINEDLCTGALNFDEPLLLAILLNVEDVMKPDMVFLVPTPHTEKEIRECFFNCDLRPHEAAAIKSFQLMNPGDNLRKHPMTPVMEGAISLVRSLGHCGLKHRLLEARKNS
jgi:hypothetical protein